MSTKKQSLKSRLGHFFYAEEVPYGAALLRMLLPVALLCTMLLRWPFARELYSTDGAPTPLWESFGTSPLYPELSPILAVAMHSVLLLTLLTTCVGWCTRSSLILSTVLYVCLSLLDAVSTITKYSVIATHVLLLLSFSKCGAIWSVDSWLKRRHAFHAGEPLPAKPRVSMWPQRLIQLLIGIVYLGAGITKIHTPAFFSGDQMHTWLVTMANHRHPVGDLLALYPSMLVVFGYAAITWEITFLFLCWKGWGRILCLGFGTAFHLMTTLTLGLYIFPMVCVPIYLTFLNERDIERIAGLFRKLGQSSRFLTGSLSTIRSVAGSMIPPIRIAVPSTLLFACAIFAVGAGGVQLEHWLDPYGKRRPEGPYTLKKLDREYVEGTLFAPFTNIRNVDKFGTLSLGTMAIGEQVAFHKSEFRQGETMLAQCILNPPHEDLWVSCCLLDAENRLIDVVGQVIPRDVLRANYTFRLSESLDPGEYAIIIKNDGKEVVRRRFRLNPGSKWKAAVVAN